MVPTGHILPIFLIITVEHTTPPVISNCPTPVTYSIPATDTSRVVIWEPPTAQDDSGTVNVFDTHRPGDSFPVGVTQVFYIFTDESGNRAMCTFTITIGKFVLISFFMCVFTSWSNIILLESLTEKTILLIPFENNFQLHTNSQGILW